MFVVLTRMIDEEQGGVAPLSVNPAYVAAVFTNINGGATIVRMADGRGFRVMESYEEASSRLSSNLQVVQ